MQDAISFVIMFIFIYIVIFVIILDDDDNKKQKITVTKEGKQVDIKKICPICRKGVLVPTMLQNKYKCDYCNHVEYTWGKR